MWQYTTKPVGHPGLFVWFWSKCWVCVSPGSVSVVASWAWLWSISICWTLSLLDRSTRPCSDCQYTHVHTCSIVHVFSRVYVQLKQLQLMCVSDEHLRNKWSVAVVCQSLTFASVSGRRTCLIWSIWMRSFISLYSGWKTTTSPTSST